MHTHMQTHTLNISQIIHKLDLEFQISGSLITK